jgi:hypothetical protein
MNVKNIQITRSDIELVRVFIHIIIYTFQSNNEQYYSTRKMISTKRVKYSIILH